MDLATRVILGQPLADMKGMLTRRNGMVAIKKPVFSFEKLPDLSRALGPVMKSTGEIMITGKTVEEVMRKSNLVIES